MSQPIQIADILFQYLVRRQEAAEQESCYKAYVEDVAIMPNDAIYMMRVNNIQQVCKLIEEMVTVSQKSVAEVLKKAIEPNISEITKSYNFTGPALNALIEHFTKPENAL